jgi:hypothetical protein
MKDKIHAKWKAFWFTLGIRHLGMSPDDFIPTPKDRCEYGFINGYELGHTDGYGEGKHEAIELCIGLLYHQYQTIKTFHGKEAEMSLLLKNCILEIRNAQAQEMEK